MRQWVNHLLSMPVPIKQGILVRVLQRNRTSRIYTEREIRGDLLWGLAHIITQVKSHNLPPVSWRPRKPVM